MKVSDKETKADAKKPGDKKEDSKKKFVPFKSSKMKSAKAAASPIVDKKMGNWPAKKGK